MDKYKNILVFMFLTQLVDISHAASLSHYEKEHDYFEENEMASDDAQNYYSRNIDYDQQLRDKSQPIYTSKTYFGHSSFYGLPQRSLSSKRENVWYPARIEVNPPPFFPRENDKPKSQDLTMNVIDKTVRIATIPKRRFSVKPGSYDNKKTIDTVTNIISQNDLNKIAVSDINFDDKIYVSNTSMISEETHKTNFFNVSQEDITHNKPEYSLYEENHERPIDIYKTPNNYQNNLKTETDEHHDRPVDSEHPDRPVDSEHPDRPVDFKNISTMNNISAIDQENYDLNEHLESIDSNEADGLEKYFDDYEEQEIEFEDPGPSYKETDTEFAESEYSDNRNTSVENYPSLTDSGSSIVRTFQITTNVGNSSIVIQKKSRSNHPENILKENADELENENVFTDSKVTQLNTNGTNVIDEGDLLDNNEGSGDLEVMLGDEEPLFEKFARIKHEDLLGNADGSGDVEVMLGDEASLNEKSARIVDIFNTNNASNACTTPKNESGHCTQLTSCFMSDVFSNFNLFTNYVCFLKGRFVGICCPDNPVVEISDGNTDGEKDNLTSSSQPQEGCGLNINTRIVGGTMSVPHEWTWMVALMRRNRFYCGGVIINDLYVLTAAHCVMGIRLRDLKVRVGEFNFLEQNEHQQDISVSEIKRHAQFVTLTFQHDIALLKLKRRIQYSKFVGSICLPEEPDNQYSDVNATVVGWGTISFGGSASPMLRQVTIPVWSNTECDETYIFETITDSFLCAGSPKNGEDACQGDSGGPLMALGPTGRWEVIGIVSWGRRCGDPTYPGVYTRVSSYLKWIAENAK